MTTEVHVEIIDEAKVEIIPPTKAKTSKSKAEKADASPLLKNGKFGDRLIAAYKLPDHLRQFYESEKIKDGLSLRLVVGKKRATWYVATYNEHGKTILTQIGYFPYEGRKKLTPSFDSEQARDRARELFKDPQRMVREKEAGSFGEVYRAWFAATKEDEGLRKPKKAVRGRGTRIAEEPARSDTSKAGTAIGPRK